MGTQLLSPCTRCLLAGLFFAALTSLSPVQAQESAIPERAVRESAVPESAMPESAAPESTVQETTVQESTMVRESATATVPSDLADGTLLPDADEDQLKPGEFLWLPSAQRNTGAPLTIIVNLSAQRAYVYRDGEPIAITTVSTGRPGRETPTGTFEILQKERMHHSTLYDDAPMPFMQRLTWDGVALHAGHISGKPASHGCIRLPPKFAEQLYGMTERGESVVVSEDGSAEALARAGLNAPIGLLADTGTVLHKMIRAMGPEPAPSAGAGTAADLAGDNANNEISFSR